MSVKKDLSAAVDELPESVSLSEAIDRLYRAFRLKQAHPKPAAEADLLGRVEVDATVCGGLPHLRGTRIEVSVILDSLADGLSYDELLDHYPQLVLDDIRAAIAYGGALARERAFKLAR